MLIARKKAKLFTHLCGSTQLGQPIVHRALSLSFSASVVCTKSVVSHLQTYLSVPFLRSI